MIEPNKREVILSVETAVGGGSLSILENGAEIGGWDGTLKISGAEEILEQIEKLLTRNDVAKNQIKLISVSKNIGSLTGQKIGLALTKGLAKSLKCSLIETCVLEALLLEVKDNFEGKYVTAVADGKNRVWWQLFATGDNLFRDVLEPRVSSEDEFYKSVKQIDFKKLVLWFESPRNITSATFIISDKQSEKLIISEQSLAKLAGLKIARQNASDNPKLLNSK